MLKNSQLKEADDQLTGWFAATTAQSKLSELCSYLHSYIPTNWFAWGKRNSSVQEISLFIASQWETSIDRGQALWTMDQHHSVRTDDKILQSEVYNGEEWKTT